MDSGSSSGSRKEPFEVCEADRSDTYIYREPVQLYERSFSDIPLSDVGCVVQRAPCIVSASPVGYDPSKLDIHGFSNRPDRGLSINT